MKQIWVYILFFSAVSSLFSQENPCWEPSKKALKAYDKYRVNAVSLGEKIAQLEQIHKDFPEYVEILDELSSLYKKQAEIAAENPNTFNKSLNYERICIAKMHKITEVCPKYAGAIMSIKLGEYYYMDKNYSQAKVYFNQFLANNDSYQKEIAAAKKYLNNISAYEFLINNKVPFEPVKVKGGVNTKWNEYLPMLSPDNRYLYFTREKEIDTKATFDRYQKVELLTESRRVGTNTFSSGLDMPERLNIGQYQGGTSISVDNSLLFITVVNLEPMKDGRLYDNADIYYSERKNGQWGELKSIGDHINGRLTWEGQPCISSDNQTLYFTSAREQDNFGGMDIYKVERLPNGKWGNPINLGDSINTTGNDKSPFMHADSYTLYFSSDGHIGMGGFDIFYSKMDEQANFYFPKNLGNPINTDKDEHGFVVSTDGKYGYFASNLDGTSLDICSFELYESARPKKVVFVEGSIKSESGIVPENVEIELKTVDSERTQKGVVNEETGNYVAVVAVEEEEDVLLTAKKEGYAFTSQLISSNEKVIGKPVKQEQMEIKEIKPEEKHTINDINFAINSYELSKQSKFILDGFVEFLEINPTVKIAIYGHTDNVGDDNDNLLLSKNRAREVQNYLISKGIDENRLSYDGFGESQPIASNENEEGRAKNRRTEFLILSK